MLQASVDIYNAVIENVENAGGPAGPRVSKTRKLSKLGNAFDQSSDISIGSLATQGSTTNISLGDSFSIGRIMNIFEQMNINGLYEYSLYGTGPSNSVNLGTTRDINGDYAYNSANARCSDCGAHDYSDSMHNCNYCNDNYSTFQNTSYEGWEVHTLQEVTGGSNKLDVQLNTNAWDFWDEMTGVNGYHTVVVGKNQMPDPAHSWWWDNFEDDSNGHAWTFPIYSTQHTCTSLPRDAKFANIRLNETMGEFFEWETINDAHAYFQTHGIGGLSYENGSWSQFVKADNPHIKWKSEFGTWDETSSYHNTGGC